MLKNVENATAVHVCVCLRPQVSELVKLPALAKPKVVLGITDLTLPLGRRVAAKAISAL